MSIGQWRRVVLLIVFGGCAAIPLKLLGDLEGSYILPLDHAAIQYATAALDDPVTRLKRRISEGKVSLSFEPDHGYLPALLKELDVPVSSQVLVFSKTSFQAPRISPRTPRALYFKDDVSLGWVRGGDVLEIATTDPRQGTIFYTIDQEEASKPRIERRGECLQCHASPGTVGVPGLVVRSIYPEPSGMPLFHAGSFVTDHRSPLNQRWGGWYVTGTHGSQRHMGNVFVMDRDHPDKLDMEAGANVTDLTGRFDTGAFLSSHSDIIALMVLEHQTRMTSLITRLAFETRMALHDQKAINQALGRPAEELTDSTKRRIGNVAEALVKYMLFVEETALEDPIKGTSGFAAEFAKKGPRDSSGRSLRELEATTRLFRYPCSYLIYSEAFDALPVAAKDRVYRRLWEILSGQDQSSTFARLSNTDRRNILEILLETKPGLPDYFRSPRAD